MGNPEPRLSEHSDVPNRTALAAALPQGGVGAELGVLGGRFSAILLEKASPEVLYLVDLWCGQYTPKGQEMYGVRGASEQDLLRTLRATTGRFAKEIAQGRVRVICDDTLRAARYVPDDSLDWVYVDAQHNLRNVLADLCVWYGKVKCGGIVAGHDYGTRRCGVREAVQLFSRLIGAGSVGVTGDSHASFWFRKPGG